MLLHRPVLREGVLHDELCGGAGVADAVLGHAGEGAGVLGEHLLYHQRRLVVVRVVDLQREFISRVLVNFGTLLVLVIFCSRI